MQMLKHLIQPNVYSINTKEVKTLVGVGIFVHMNVLSAHDVADKIKTIDSRGLELKTVSSKGLKL